MNRLQDELQEGMKEERTYERCSGCLGCFLYIAVEIEIPASSTIICHGCIARHPHGIEEPT